MSVAGWSVGLSGMKFRRPADEVSPSMRVGEWVSPSSPSADSTDDLIEKIREMRKKQGKR